MRCIVEGVNESESLTKKLEHGLKLSEVRVKDGKKNKHVSKNWMKDELSVF